MTAEGSLRTLWQEAFGDTEAFLDAFFATGFSGQRHHVLWDSGEAVSALYWFDCTLSGHKLAYLYAVATRRSHRGKGLAKRLLGETHALLTARGYSGAVLVPGSAALFDFYEKLGYRKSAAAAEISCPAGDASIALHAVDAQEYGRLRQQYLPEGGMTLSGAMLAFMQTQYGLFAGDGFVLAGCLEDGVLRVQELLGYADMPAVLCALGAQRGLFRTPGEGRDFAMYLPFVPDCPVPAYLGPALD